MVRVKLPPKLECRRCGHAWWARQVEVNICPKCKNPRWDEFPMRKAAKKSKRV